MSAIVEVIVVNYNAGEALQRCLDAAFGQGPDVCVTVVDNASSDGSAERAEARFGGRADFRLLRQADNPGFAAAVNRAVRAGGLPKCDSSPGFLLILNPDCDLQPGALPELLAALQQDPAAALAAPRVTDPRGRVLRGTLRRFPDPWKSFVTFSGLWRLGRRWPLFEGVERSAQMPAETAPAEAVSGACMLLRKDRFFEIGGMDSEYRLHCEDLDLMYRLRRAGYHCLLVPGARAVHAQGTSSARRPLWVLWQKHRGMQRFFDKFQAESYALPLRWGVRAGIWLRFLLQLPLALVKASLGPLQKGRGAAP